MQGDVDAALGRLVGSAVNSTGAGRTDAGVHALGQVMTVPELPDDLDLTRVKDSLNGMLGPAISISRCKAADPGFNARFSARSRTYFYAILESEVPDPFLAGTALWHRRSLDVDAMNEAAGHLVGEHDWSSFGRVESDRPAVRDLFELRCARDGRILRVRARANAFLQQMVRSLVGTLVYVGEGRRSPDEVPGLLAARDRAAAGPVAPPHGLCLVSVEYDEGWSLPVMPD